MLASTAIIAEDFEKKKFDDKKIRKIIEVMKKEQELQGFLYRVDICNRLKKFQGFYSFQDRHLMINLKGIQYSYEDFLDKNPLRVGTGSDIRHYNILVTDTIIHELGHATQGRESVKPLHDTIHQIVKEGIGMGIRTPYQIRPYKFVFTKLFYKSILLERQAEFNSLYSILQRNEEADFLSNREAWWLELRLSKLAATGYGKHHTPASKYYALRGKYNQYRNLPLDEDYSLEERLSWGLPVDHSVISTIKEGLKIQDPQLKLLLK